MSATDWMILVIIGVAWTWLISVKLIKPLRKQKNAHVEHVAVKFKSALEVVNADGLPTTLTDNRCNPFPACTLEKMNQICSRLYTQDPSDHSVDAVLACYEVAELAKWIIAHATIRKPPTELNAADFVYLCMTLNNPHNVSTEQLFLNAMRATHRKDYQEQCDLANARFKTGGTVK